MRENMLFRGRGLGIAALAAALTGGCGGDDTSSSGPPARTTAACGRIMDAICAKYVECKVTEGGTQITADICARSRSAQINSCTTNQGAGIAAASDADVDACVTGLQSTVCTNICNQVPKDPEACHKVSPAPNTDNVTCAP